MHRGGYNLATASLSSFCLQVFTLFYDGLFLYLCMCQSSVLGLPVHINLPAPPAPSQVPFSPLLCHHLLCITVPAPPPPSLVAPPVCTLSIPSCQHPMKTEFTVVFYLSHGPSSFWELHGPEIPDLLTLQNGIAIYKFTLKIEGDPPLDQVTKTSYFF